MNDDAKQKARKEIEDRIGVLSKNIFALRFSMMGVDDESIRKITFLKMADTCKKAAACYEDLANTYD